MTHEVHHPTRVAIVGAGNVGTSFAYALLLNGLASEIVLIDANQDKARGEAMDLNHAAPLAQPVRVWAGGYEDCAGSVVTVVTAGSAQRPGESRLNLVQRNASIFQQIIPQIVKNNPEGIILIATNPVDVLTYVALKQSGLPANQVFGSGTILDTARFRYLLSQQFDVDPRSVHAYIIGEHGDSEVPVWSLANIAGMRLDTYCEANNMACTDQSLELDLRTDPRRRLPHYRVERRHLLRDWGRFAAHCRSHLARPEHGAVGLQLANGILRHLGCVLQPADGYRPGRSRARGAAAPGPGRG